MKFHEKALDEMTRLKKQERSLKILPREEYTLISVYLGNQVNHSLAVV